MTTIMEEIPTTMFAVVTTGNGGIDKLELRQSHPVPRPANGEVLVRVLAAGKVISVLCIAFFLSQ
jgi:hypothetical protein